MDAMLGDGSAYDALVSSFAPVQQAAAAPRQGKQERAVKGHRTQVCAQWLAPWACVAPVQPCWLLGACAGRGGGGGAAAPPPPPPPASARRLPPTRLRRMPLCRVLPWTVQLRPPADQLPLSTSTQQRLWWAWQPLQPRRAAAPAPISCSTHLATARQRRRPPLPVARCPWTPPRAPRTAGRRTSAGPCQQQRPQPCRMARQRPFMTRHSVMPPPRPAARRPARAVPAPAVVPAPAAMPGSGAAAAGSTPGGRWRGGRGCRRRPLAWRRMA